ncbi:MAG: hypothetical protein ACYC4R_15935 [Anaerolineae bacterium]
MSAPSDQPEPLHGLTFWQTVVSGMAGSRTARAEGGRAPVVVAAIVLCLLISAVLMVGMKRLGLFADDWLYREAVAAPDTLFRNLWARPWEAVLRYGQWRAFGQSLIPYYAVLLGLQVASGLALFAAMARIIPGRLSLAFVAALLYAVYPTDQSRFWLSTVAYRFGALCLLSSAFVAASRNPNRRLPTVLAALLYACAVLSNELFAALLVLPWLAGMAQRRPSWRHALMALLPYMGVLALILAFRFAGPRWLGLEDVNAQLLTWSWADVWHKLGDALFTNLREGWVYALGRTFDAGHSSTLLLPAGLALSGAACVARLTHHDAAQPGERVRGARLLQWGLLAPGCLVVMFLGYAPLMFSPYGIGIGDIGTRINAAGSIGAALFVAVLLDMLARTVAWLLHRPFLGRLSLAVGVGCLALVAFGQVRAVQNDYALAWQIQQQLWVSLAAEVPNPPRAAYILLVGAPRTVGSARVLSEPYEVAPALRALYGDPSISGDVLHAAEWPPTLGEAPRAQIQFDADHLLTRYQRYVVPYERVVVVEVDAAGRVSVLGTAAKWAANLPLL